MAAEVDVIRLVERAISSCAAWGRPEYGALGQRVDPERGAVGVRQPVDGQPLRDVVDRGPGPGDVRVVGTPVGHKVLAKPRTDQLGERNPVP
jgi:hypothetical protein